AMGVTHGFLATPVPSPKVQITVADLTSQLPIRSGDTLTSSDTFQVTVTTQNGVDCAGQFIVTARGDSGSPPSVFGQNVPFIIGPAVGSNAASGDPLTASVLSDGTNDWKISTSCNGAMPTSFGTDSFEFFVLTSSGASRSRFTR